MVECERRGEEWNVLRDRSAGVGRGGGKRGRGGGGGGGEELRGFSFRGVTATQSKN